MRAALVQFTGSDDPGENLARVAALVDRAADAGAEFVLTPEVTNCLSGSRSHQSAVLRPEAEDPVLAGLRAQAARREIWILAGSLALKTGDADGRFANRSLLIAPDGAVAARYDKIHMFDVTLSETESYRESAGYRPGHRAVVADTPFARLGLSVCYDLRFPALYRALAQAGAEVLTVPSAFAVATGQAHWEPLLRARAIECGAYVLAPAQVGRHPARRGPRRETYGHAMAVDPWGKVIAVAGTGQDVIFAEIDRGAVTEARHKVPALHNDRPYAPPEGGDGPSAPQQGGDGPCAPQ